MFKFYIKYIFGKKCPELNICWEAHSLFRKHQSLSSEFNQRILYLIIIIRS